ncbi:uncharacterized protein LOC119568860 [Penaeus monodon]|uniref:uncharacterized protein LOC119568860 n=1 Tax=Penaeus monodon TaxID=6687 RepID=UPI0018A6E1F0|nr:uncharacterized protein LOC119568860 [Penaeus monodon]
MVQTALLASEPPIEQLASKADEIIAIQTTPTSFSFLHHPGSTAIVDEGYAPQYVTPTAAAVPRLQQGALVQTPLLVAGKRGTAGTSSAHLSRLQTPTLRPRQQFSPAVLGGHRSGSQSHSRIPQRQTIACFSHIWGLPTVLPLNVYGECSLTLLFSGTPHSKLTWVFLVADVQQPILGADFLAHHGFTVDLRRECLVHSQGPAPTPVGPAASGHLPAPFFVRRTATGVPFGGYRPSIQPPHRTATPPAPPLLHTGALGVHDFSKIDLVRAYHPKPHRQGGHFPKTAVTTPFGPYEFLRMPFGLRNAALTFQRFMDVVPAAYRASSSTFDDIIIASSNSEEHQQHLRAPLTACREPESSSTLVRVFSESPSHLLGHTITADGITQLRRRAAVSGSFPKPTMKTQLRKYPSMINFFRRFIPKCALLRHLCNVSSAPSRSGRGRDVTWTFEAIEAFWASKDALASATLLNPPQQGSKAQYSRRRLGHCHGSSLQQDSGKRVGNPCFLFTDSQPTTKRYSAFGKELLAFTTDIPKHLGHQQPGFQTPIQGLDIHGPIRSKVVWPGINRDVRQWCRTCIEFSTQ